jgi:RNA polymerase sigma-70 factor (ECF subfamily)
MDIKRKRALNTETWVDDYGDALYHFALAQVRKKDIAEDLVQETFLSAVRSQKRFKGLSSEKTWLFGILKHKVMEYFRKVKALSRVDATTVQTVDADAFPGLQDGWPAAAAHWSTDPDAAHAKKEFWEHLLQCLSRLPKRTADAFVYREIDGLSTAEICKQLGISAANCGTMLYRARLRLRHAMGVLGYHSMC